MIFIWRFCKLFFMNTLVYLMPYGFSSLASYTYSALSHYVQIDVFIVIECLSTTTCNRHPLLVSHSASCFMYFYNLFIIGSHLRYLILAAVVFLSVVIFIFCSTKG